MSLSLEAPPARLTPTLVASTLIAALGGLLFGFDTAVISGTTEALRSVFGLSGSGLGFTVASALIGTILGAILGLLSCTSRPASVAGPASSMAPVFEPGSVKRITGAAICLITVPRYTRNRDPFGRKQGIFLGNQAVPMTTTQVCGLMQT